MVIIELVAFNLFDFLVLLVIILFIMRRITFKIKALIGFQFPYYIHLEGSYMWIVQKHTSGLFLRAVVEIVIE